jgi:hypothetical protein
MAQPKDFLYSLTDENGRSYRRNNGLVEAVSKPTPLPETPDGWQEKSIRFQRSLDYLSLFRTFTNPLKFVKTGALILRDRFYKKGTEEKVYLVIHRLAKYFGGGWLHKFFYRGEIDLSQFSDEDTHVEVNIMEGGLSKLLKANENTVYEIDVDVPEAVSVKMDGLKLKQTATYLITNGTLENDFGAHIVETNLINQESIQSLGARSTTRTVLNSSTDIFPSGQYILEIGNSATEITIKYNFGITLGLAPGIGAIPGTRYFWQIRAYNKDGTQVLFDNIIDFNPGDPLLLYRHNIFSGTATYTIPANTKVFIDSSISTNINVTRFTYDDDYSDENGGILEISYSYTHPTTYIKALRPVYIAQKLLDKITGGGYTFSSNYLSAVWENLLTTSGDAVRGIPGARLKISWTDFYRSYNVPCNLCMGIRNGALYIERKKDAFQSYIQQSLTNARDLTVSTCKDFQYGSVKVGYPNTDTEDVNGRDEFNVTQVYTSPITRTSKVLDLVSKIRASMYEIELTRINLEGRTTTDDSNDNNAFFLHVEKTATAGTGTEPATYYKLLRETYTSISGIISPETAFNIGLSPKRCLLAHGNFLRSIFWGQDAGYLVFQTSDKNAELTTVKDGVTISEKGNVLIGNLDPALFIPLEFKFESPMPADIIETMNDGPDGTFAVPYDGATLYGFPMEIGIQPANRPAQETVLLCSPQTNLENLITYGR